MKKQSIMMTWLLSAAILSACSGQPAGGQAQNTNSAPTAAESSASSASATTETAAASATPLSGGLTELKSKDGKIKASVSGAFSDKSADETVQPEGVSADNIQLLQQDNDTGTVLSVIHSGSTKNAADYFAKVKAAIESDKSLKNVVFGDVSSNSMRYGFSQTDESGNPSLNEECLILMSGEQIYTTCASNPEAQASELSELLKFVSTAD